MDLCLVSPGYMLYFPLGPAFVAVRVITDYIYVMHATQTGVLKCELLVLLLVLVVVPM